MAKTPLKSKLKPIKQTLFDRPKTFTIQNQFHNYELDQPNSSKEW